MATHHELTAQAEPVAHEDVVTSYTDAPTCTVSAGGVNFAYRELVLDLSPQRLGRRHVDRPSWRQSSRPAKRHPLRPSSLPTGQLM